MTTFILFIVVIALLIFVHELGHFLAAKWSGVKVEEFAIGFPPTIFSLTKGDTKYSINLIPFGGYVKIFGEDYNEGSQDKDSFVNQPKYIQAFILVAGVLFNFIFAWFIFIFLFNVGFPMSINQAVNYQQNPETKLLITAVVDNSPAYLAGLMPGDEILEIKKTDEVLVIKSTTDLQTVLQENKDEPLSITYNRQDQMTEVDLVPSQTIDNIDGWAVGLALDTVALVNLNWYQSLWQSLKFTTNLSISMVLGLGELVKMLIDGSNLNDLVVGPIGIAGLVGGASNLGFVYLLSLIALISINLAIINLMPFPALDGGRLLFLLIEKIKGSNLNPQVAGWVNLVGFAILIILMLYITWGDIIRIFPGII